MRHEDKFPPNAFLKRTIMKTPGRFFVFIFGLIFTIFGSEYLWPEAALNVIRWCAVLLIPGVLVMLVWQIIWSWKNPEPPPEVCQTCKQTINNKQ